MVTVLNRLAASTLLISTQLIMNLFVQVYTQMQKMLLSLSRYRTVVYLDKLGESHDAHVLNWKSIIEQEMKSSKVRT